MIKKFLNKVYINIQTCAYSWFYIIIIFVYIIIIFKERERADKSAFKADNEFIIF